MNVLNSQLLTRRRALEVIGGAVAGLSLHGCRAADPNTLTLGLTTWIGYTPLHIAIAKGFFKNLGLDIKLQTFESGVKAFPGFLAGQIQGIAPVTAEVVTLAAQGADFRIVLVEDTSTGADAVLVRNSIAGVQDLKGKKIGAELGGVGHFFVLQMLAKVGLSEKDVQFVNLAPDAAAAAFQKGDLEVVYTYSPFSEQALKARQDGRVLFSSREMPTAIADVYIFSTQVIQSNPTAIAAFVQGYFQALDFLRTNPQEGLAIAAKQFNLTPTELEQQLKGIQMPDLAMNVEMLSDVKSERSLLKPMTDLANFLKASGKITAVPNMANYLDPQFVRALKA